MNPDRAADYIVGVDFSTLDHLTLGCGQYRYLVDLITCMTEDPLRGVRVKLFGSKAEPVPELRSAWLAGKLDYRQISRSRGRWAYLADHVRYSMLIRREKIDLWHAPHSFIPAFAACPVVVTLYDLMEHLFEEYRFSVNSKQSRMFYWLLRRKAAAVICISETTRADLLRFYPIAPERAIPVLLGTRITTQVTDPEAGRDLQARFPNAFGQDWLASPYNLEPRKNLLGLLEAFARISQDLPALNLVLFGRAAWTQAREEKFMARVAELGLTGRVILTGFLDDRDLAWVYRECTVFVFPTLYEGFGLPLLEAMAQGACTMAHADSAMREVAGEAGILTNMSDASILGASIREILGDPDRQKHLRHAAKERAALFTVDRMTRQTLDVYSKLLNPAKGARASAAGEYAG